MKRYLGLCLRELEGADLSGYTLRRRPTDFSGAQSDVDVYDEGGRLVASGRDFGTVCYFWPNAGEKTYAAWYEGSRSFEPPHRRLL
jgi:hypothetical protein